MPFTEKQLAHIASEVFACSHYPMIITDRTGIIVAANRAFSLTSGWQTSEIIGRNMSTIHSEKHDDAFYKVIWDKLAKDGSWAGEICNKAKDGHEFRECLAIMAIHDERSATTNYIAVYCDVTKYLSRSNSISNTDRSDSLTGLLNQENIVKMLNSQISGRNHNTVCAILFLDLGHLHSIKESYGNNIGDQLLLAVSQRISACLRSIDSIGRWSDDGFVIVLPDCSNEIAERVAKRVLKSVSLQYHIEQHSLTVNFRIGISIYPWHGDEPELLIQNACKAMVEIADQQHKRIEIYSGRT